MLLHFACVREQPDQIRLAFLESHRQGRCTAVARVPVRQPRVVTCGEIGQSLTDRRLEPLNRQGSPCARVVGGASVCVVF